MSYTTPLAVTNQRIADLRSLWGKLFPLDIPNEATFRTWLSSHSFLSIAYGLSEASKRFCRVQGQMSQGEIIRYSSRVMGSRTKVLEILKRQEKEHQQCQQKSTTTEDSPAMR